MTGKKPLSLSRKKAVLGVLFVSPWLFGFIFLFLVPLLQSFRYSLNKLTLDKGGFHTSFAGWDFYKELFYAHPTFNRVLLESISDLAVKVPSITIFSLFVATLLNQKFRGRAFARAVFFLPVLLASSALTLEKGTSIAAISSTVTGISAEGDSFGYASFQLSMILFNAGMSSDIVFYLADSVSGIYEIISSCGVQILIFLAGLQTITPSLYEAAKIEGTTGYEAFWKITLPMISPLLLTNIVYTVIDSYKFNDLNKLIRETAFLGLDFSLSAAMAWVYFATTAALLAVIVWLVSRKVFYYD